MPIVAPHLPTTGRRRALVICNGTFDDPDMQRVNGVMRDHAEVARVLGGCDAGFDVTALLDRGLVDIRRAIAEICASSEPDDLLLLYYSGTSRRDAEGYLYLGARDSRAQYPSATMLEAEFVLREFCRSPARHTVFLLDTCYAAAFFTHNRGVPNGLYAITACGVDEKTPDSDDGGVFTRAVLAGLESSDADLDGDGLISIDELHEHVRKELGRGTCTARPQKWTWNVREPIYLATAPPRVFLSYCREDVALAELVKGELESRGLSVWIDLEGVRSGDWKDRVTSGLGKARALVVLLTPTSLRSIAVRKELGFAAVKDVPLMPISMAALSKKELPDWYLFDYGTVHRRVIGDATRAADFDELASAIRSIRKPPRGE
jgi:hypothetical protein